MSEEYNYTPQEEAQAIIKLSREVAAEFGWSIDCEKGYDAARRLYEEHGPFELSFGYGRRVPEWYDE